MPFYMIKRKYNVIGGNMMQLKKKKMLWQICVECLCGEVLLLFSIVYYCDACFLFLVD